MSGRCCWRDARGLVAKLSDECKTSLLFSNFFRFLVSHSMSQIVAFRMGGGGRSDRYRRYEAISEIGKKITKNISALFKLFCRIMSTLRCMFCNSCIFNLVGDYIKSLSTFSIITFMKVDKGRINN